MTAADHNTLAGQDAVDLWLAGKDAWNKWVEKHLDWTIDFSNYDFSRFENVIFDGMNFPNKDINFTGANFSRKKLPLLNLKIKKKEKIF